MKAALSLCLVLGLAACGAKAAPPCQGVTYDQHDYTICKAASDADIRLFLKRENGKPFFSFEAVQALLTKEEGAHLLFAMNAGMYHEDRSPGGLYTEASRQAAPLNTTARDGNFGLVPNGVFYMADGRAGVAETTVFVEIAPEVTFATQSGPMLVIDGALHPKFNANGPSKKKRNGVGITDDHGTGVQNCGNSPRLR